MAYRVLIHAALTAVNLFCMLGLYVSSTSCFMDICVVHNVGTVGRRRHVVQYEAPYQEHKRKSGLDICDQEHVPYMLYLEGRNQVSIMAQRIQRSHV